MQYGSPQGPAQYAMMPQSPAPKKTKKRLAVVAAVSAACLASAGVYATVLQVTANQAAAGSAAVTSCDATGVETQTSVPTWDETGQIFKIATITVSDIAAACDGQTVYLQILNAEGEAERAALSHVYVHSTDAGSYVFTTTDLDAAVYGGSAVVIHETL